MKFAGPNMGAALGSGVMGGLASAQDMAAREELARDTSAMATYSKLVSSGEWEPVGKEGVKGGGVLRVGNVGFLKKVSKPQVLSLKDQLAIGRFGLAQEANRRAEEKAVFSKEHPPVRYDQVMVDGKLTSVKTPVGQDVVYPKGAKPVIRFGEQAAQVSAEKLETGRVLKDVRSDLVKVGKELNGAEFGVFRFGTEEKIQANKEKYSKRWEKYQGLLTEEKELTEERDRLSRTPIDVGGGVKALRRWPSSGPPPIMSGAEEFNRTRKHRQEILDAAKKYDLDPEKVKGAIKTLEDKPSLLEFVMSGGGRLLQYLVNYAQKPSDSIEKGTGPIAP